MMIPSTFRMKPDDSDKIIEVEVFVMGYFVGSDGVPQCSAVTRTGGFFHAVAKAFTAQMPGHQAEKSNIVTLTSKPQG